MLYSTQLKLKLELSLAIILSRAPIYFKNDQDNIFLYIFKIGIMSSFIQDRGIKTKVSDLEKAASDASGACGNF